MFSTNAKLSIVHRCCTSNMTVKYNAPRCNYRDMSHNRIEMIMSDTFEKLRSLKNLVLSHNRISLIETGAFSELHSLNILWVQHSPPPSSLPQHTVSTTFTPQSWLLSRWKTLALFELPSSSTKIIVLNGFSWFLIQRSVSFIVDVHVCQSDLSCFCSELDHNDISWTVEDMNGAFDGLSALSRLDLSANRIRTVSKRAFSGLDSLRQLNLVRNPISTINSNAFSPLHELHELWVALVSSAVHRCSPQIMQCLLLFFTCRHVVQISKISPEVKNAGLSSVSR